MEREQLEVLEVDSSRFDMLGVVCESSRSPEDGGRRLSYIGTGKAEECPTSGKRK